MTQTDRLWRRNLARALTQQGRATVQETLDRTPKVTGASHRIGITGPPGVGKSSLIAMLSKYRLDKGRKMGVLAVDPTSPVSGGSLLGDRVRMDATAENPDLFIRSVPSGSYFDGLCPNVLGLLDVFDQAEFDDIILETVGVGQINYVGRELVDTFILVLAPESGDTIQAMKAGILETADIYVVNKSDLSAAEKLASELQSVARWRANSDGWSPEIVKTSTYKELGSQALSECIDRHLKTTKTPERTARLARARREYQLRSLLSQRLDEILASNPIDWDADSLSQALDLIAKRMSSGSL